MARENLIISIKAEDMASNVIHGVASSIRTLANDLLYTASIQIADGIIDATKALGSFQMELELTDIAFTQMVKGADRGRASLEEYTNVARALRNELHDLAAETPFSFQDVNRGARQLMAYGFGVKEIEPMLRTIGDAAAAFGGSPIAIYRTIRALGQIKAYGRLKGQELLQLTEVGIPAHEILREELHLSSEQLSRIADQHIPAQEAIDAILRGIEKRYAGMMEVQSRTMQGSIAAIKDNLMLVGTQLTRSIYDEVRDTVRSFRLSLDDYKDMTRVAGWRGLFGQHRFYDREGKEVNVSKMTDEELNRRIHRDEITHVFSTDRYYDKEGKLFDTTGKSQQELDAMVQSGQLEKRGPIIPLDWQESIFVIGDAFLDLAKSVKELGSALGSLWNTMFGGSRGMADVGNLIFRMINGFILLTTWVVKAIDGIGQFIGKTFEAYTGGKLFQGILFGIASALAMTFAMNILQNILLFMNTFKMMFGYAGIVGSQFGLLISVTYLVGQTSSQAAVGVMALGSAIMLLAHRAQIAAAFMLAWAGVMRGIRTVFAPIIAVVAGIRAVIGPAIAAFTMFRSATTALTASLLALRGAYGFTRLGAIAVTAAVAAGTTVVIAARAAFGLFYTALLTIRTAYLVATGAASTFHITLVAGMALQRTWVGICAIASGAITALSVAVNGFTTVLTICRTAMAAFTALGAGPMIAVILALSVIFYTVYNNWTSIWKAITNGFSAFIDWILDGIKSLSKGAYDTLIKGFEWIGEKVSNLWKNYIKDWLGSLGEFAKRAIEVLSPLTDTLFGSQKSLSRRKDNKIRQILMKYEIDPYGANKLSDYDKDYKVEIPKDTGAGKQAKKPKTEDYTKEVPLGEYWAYVATSLDGVNKSVDDLLPGLFKASDSFKHLTGGVEEFAKYAESLVGKGINNSVLYNANDTNFIPKYGDVVLYTGEDGKQHSGIYMGNGKVRTAADEVVSEWVKRTIGGEQTVKAKDIKIGIQAPGECTVESSKAFLDYYGQDSSGLTTRNWFERVSSFIGNRGYDVQSYEDFDQKIRELNEKGIPAIWYQTAGQGGHILNPNNSLGNGAAHAVIIQGTNENGQWVVQDPNGGITRLFNDTYGMWDETHGTTGDRQGVPTGGALFYTTRNTQKQTSDMSVYRNWLDNLMPYRLRDDIIEHTIKTAQQFNVDPSLVFSIMRQESEGNPESVSPVGALGYMQLMPDTAAVLGVNPYDEFENITGGIKYIAKQLQTFGGNVDLALAAYNAGPGAVLKHNGIPPYAETQHYVSTISDYYNSAPNISEFGEIGQSTVKIVEQEIAKVVQDNLKNVSDLSNVRFFSMSEATDEKGKIVIKDQTKEQKKALDEFYKRQSQINKAVEEYNTYMGASKLKLDEINGNFTEYREKVLEVRSEFAKTAEQAQKLVGQGLSREDANKMIDRAKEVADAILKEFERVRKIKFEIDFKTNQSKIAELNHDFDKSLSLQKEAETLQLDADAFEAGKEILKDASAIPEIMAEYAKVRNTGQSFGEFMQDLLSVDEPFAETNSKFADFIKNNEGLWEYWVTLVDAKSQELKQKFELLGKTIYSRTAESYANQGDLQGLLGYLQSPEGEEQRRLEQSFTIQQEWCNRIIDMYRYLGQEVDQAMLTLHDSIIDHGTSAIMDFIKGTKSAKEAFSEFALSVMEDVVKMVLKMAMMEAVSGIFGGLFGGSKSSGFGTGMMWGNLGLAKGGAVKKGQTALVGEEGPELLSITSGKSALDSPKSMVIGAKGPEVITMPYTGYVIPNEDLLKMVGYYSDDKAIPSYMISGFRAEGGKVEKDKAYIVGEKGPEVFSPGSSGNIFSNEQVNSTLTNLDRISRSGSMGSPYENTPQQTIPPVVVNLDNKSGTQMTAQAESNFDGDQWVVSVVLDAVNRNVGGLRNIIGNVSGRR